MPQIAQQDYLVIQSPNGYGLDEPTDFIADVKDEIISAFKRGVLFDVILSDLSGVKGRVLSYSVDGTTGELAEISYCAVGDIRSVDIE